MTTISNEIEIVVRGTNRSRPAMQQPGEDIDKLKGKAKAASVDLDALGKEFAKVSQQTDDFGKKLAGGASMSDFLSTKLTRAREETRRLGEEFNKTGDTNVLKKMFDAGDIEAELSHLSKKLAAALVSGAVDGGKTAGQEGGKTLAAGLQGSMSTPVLGPALTAALIGAIALAAPPAIAGLNALLLAGVGGGGLALGIAGQMDDPRVSDAWTNMVTGLVDDWHTETADFADPLVEAADTVGAALHGALDGADLGQVAGVVGALADGVAGLITAMGPGLDDALGASGPVLAALADDLPVLGSAISDALSDMSDGSEGATMALHDLIHVVSGAIIWIGRIIWFFSELYGGAVKLADKITELGVALFAPVPGARQLADGLHQVVHEMLGGTDEAPAYGKAVGGTGQQAAAAALHFDALAHALDQTAQTSDTVAGKMVDKVMGALLAGDHATLSWEESLTKLGDSFKENGRQLDIHAEKGQANREAVLAAVEANLRMYDTNIAAGMSSLDASHAYDENTAALERQLRKAGLTTQQIDGLIGKYKGVPQKVDTDIALHGLTDAIEDLTELIRQIEGLRKPVVIDIWEVDHRGKGGRDAPGSFHNNHGTATGGIIGAASGRIASSLSGGLTWVGEQGRELVRLPYGSTVIPNGQSEAMAAGMGGGGRGGRLELVISTAPTLNRDLSDAIVENLSFRVRTAGGDVQTFLASA